MDKKGALGRIKSTFIGDRAFYQSVVKLLIPIVIQQGITSFVNLLDNVMVGALSAYIRIQSEHIRLAFRPQHIFRAVCRRWGR